MTHRPVTHGGTLYDLSHLSQTELTLQWTSENGIRIEIAVRIVYSNHCYTENIAPTESRIGLTIVRDKKIDRRFDTKRYADSLMLPAMFAELVANPTTRIYLTHEANWTVWEIVHRVGGKRYYAFFRVKRIATAANCVELFVESAYERDSSVGIARHLMFGRVLEKTLAGKRV